MTPQNHPLFVSRRDFARGGAALATAAMVHSSARQDEARLRTKTFDVIIAAVIAAGLLLVSAAGCRPDADRRPDPDAAPRAGSPPESFPKIVVASAMLWSTPHSARFRPGFGAPTYSGSGFYENAPLVPADRPDAGSDAEPHFPKDWFEDMARAGIDAVDHCFFGTKNLPVLLQTAEAARESGTGVQVLPMIDTMPAAEGMAFLVDLWRNEPLRNHPNLLRFGDRPVVMTFGVHGGDVWRQRLALAEQAGARYFVITDVSESRLGRPTVPDDHEPLHGLYRFVELDGSGLPGLAKLARSYDPPKLFGGSVMPGYIGATRQGILRDHRGTDVFRRNWLQIIDHDPAFVYLSTLNDYTEATEQECSANSTYAYIDLNAYFGGRWKTGAWPARAAGQAFLSYRKAVATTEAIELELVLLRPELTGKEDAAGIAERFRATASLAMNGADRVGVAPVQPQVFPGHLVWRFWATGTHADGYAVPAVKIEVDGAALELPAGAPAPFAIVRNGEPLSRRWLHVPLHRIRPGVAARLAVAPTGDGPYPRTIRIEGLPWDDVACGVLERQANSLSPALAPDRLRDGFREEFYAGPGWCPMEYRNGTLKRNVVDQVDRYTAVIRMHDETFVYPAPALVDPPRTLPDAPAVDPATVIDPMIGPGKKMTDRGWLKRDLVLPADATRPTAHQDDDGAWFLRFDGVDDRITQGPIAMPPGPATVELLLRPADTERMQTVFDSSEPVLSLVLAPGGTLRLLRTDQQLKVVTLAGKTPLQAGTWHHVVAVFTGRSLRLSVDGKQDGPEIPIHGLRSDKETSIGGPALWAKGIRAAGFFKGDIRQFRVLQRSLSPDEIAARSQGLSLPGLGARINGGSSPEGSLPRAGAVSAFTDLR